MINYMYLGGPRKIWVEFVSIWAGGSLKMSCVQPRDRPPLCPCGSCFARLPFPLCYRKSRSAARPGSPMRCFLCCIAGRASIKSFPPSFPQEHVLCLPSHSGHGRRETVEENDLSVPRRLRKTLWQVGDATTLRLAGGDLGDRAKQPSALSRTLSRALNITIPTVIAGQVEVEGET